MNQNGIKLILVLDTTILCREGVNPHSFSTSKVMSCLCIHNTMPGHSVYMSDLGQDPSNPPLKY